MNSVVSLSRTVVTWRVVAFAAFQFQEILSVEMLVDYMTACW